MLSVFANIFALCIGSYALILRNSSLELFRKLNIELPVITQLTLRPMAVEAFLVFQAFCLVVCLLPLLKARGSLGPKEADGGEPVSIPWVAIMFTFLSYAGAILIIASFKMPLQTIHNIMVD